MTYCSEIINKYKILVGKLQHINDSKLTALNYIKSDAILKLVHFTLLKAYIYEAFPLIPSDKYCFNFGKKSERNQADF